MKVKLMSLERKWDKEGKTPIQKARLRYYYRNRRRILQSYRTSHGIRDVWGNSIDVTRTVIEL